MPSDSMWGIDKVEAKGRNGYFTVDGVEVYVDRFYHEAQVDIYSKRIGNAPPIRVQGDRLAVTKFFRDITNILENLQQR